MQVLKVFLKLDCLLNMSLCFSLCGWYIRIVANCKNAIDLLDPFKRKSNMNKDLIAVGIGNTIAAILGGFTNDFWSCSFSSNVNNGAKTRWANFFHGFFILIFVLATPY